MSSIAEKVAPLLRPEQQNRETRRKRVRPYKPRLATKVKWALGDAMERSIAAQRRMRAILAWLDETHTFEIDDRGLAHLGKLEKELYGLALDVTELERILAAAIAESKPEVKSK